MRWALGAAVIGPLWLPSFPILRSCISQSLVWALLASESDEVFIQNPSLKIPSLSLDFIPDVANQFLSVEPRVSASLKKMLLLTSSPPPHNCWMQWKLKSNSCEVKHRSWKFGFCSTESDTSSCHIPTSSDATWWHFPTGETEMAGPSGLFLRNTC